MSWNELDQVLLGIMRSIKVSTDCKNLKNFVYFTKTIEDKRMKVDVCVLTDYLRKGQLSEIRWVDTENRLSDGLTKKGVNVSKLCDVLKVSRKFYSKSI